MGGGGETTVGYRYYLGMHMVTCMGPFDAVVAIKVDNKVAWAGSVTAGSIVINQPNLFGGDSSEGGVIGGVDILSGVSSQGVNPYLSTQLGDPLVPAFRGVVSFVLRQCYLGNNPYLKPWSFRCVRVHTRQDGLTQWYDAKAAVIPASADNGDLSLAKVDDVWKYKTLAPTDPTDYSNPAYDDSGWNSGQGGFGNSAAGFGTPPSKTIVFGGASPVTPGVIIWVRGTFHRPLAATTVKIIVYHDDGPTLWVNGNHIDLVNDDDFTSHAIVNVNSLQETNTIALKVVDSLPSGNPTFVYAGLAISANVPSFIDMNPAHILRECLTDPDWGMGYNEADMDDTSFMAAADTLFSEEMGMSLLWDKQSDIQEFITTILNHIDATIFVDRFTGKFVLKLIRDDYIVADVLELTENDIDQVQDFKRPQFGELTTSVTVQYWNSATNTDGGVTVQDIALADMQNAEINTTLNYAGFTNSTMATRIAQRDLRTLSSQIASCTVYTGRKAKNLQVGSVVKITWPDYELDRVVMRITGVAYGDGKSNRIRLTVAEDIFRMDAAPFVAVPGHPTWVDPNGPAQPATKEIAFEMPYLELVQQQTQLTIDNNLTSDPLLGLVGVAVARPTQGSINAGIYSDAGAGYTQNATADFCPVAILTTDIDRVQESFSIGSGDELDLVTLGTWVQIDEELMEIVSLTDVLIGVHRAVLDTVPVNHTSGATMYFWDKFPSADPTQYDSGESINVKLTPKTGSGTLALTDASVMTVVMAHRAIRPYPPGNLKINNQYFPAQIEGDMVLTWAHRSRTQQTGGDLVSFTDGNVGPETGTTYTLRVYNGSNTLVRTVSGITGTTTTYTGAMETTDGGPFSAFRFELATERDGYESWQVHNVSLTRPAPILTNGIFIPSASPPEANPHIIGWNNSKFIVGIEGTVDTHDTIGYYEIPDAGLIPTYIGTAYDVRGVSPSFFYRPYNGTGLEMVMTQTVNGFQIPLSALGVDEKVSVFYQRRDNALSGNYRWLISYNDSTGQMSLVNTVNAINSDLFGMLRLADGSATLAWGTDSTGTRLWRSVDGNVWSNQGLTTGLFGGGKFFQLGSTYVNVSSSSQTSTDGLVWSALVNLNSSFTVMQVVDVAYDGTALVAVGQYVANPIYNSTVLADSPVSFLDGYGAGGDRADLSRLIRIVPGGVGITGWGVSTITALAISANALEAGAVILDTGSLGMTAIGTSKGSYLESRNSSNGAINFLQGTTDFSIEMWTGFYLSPGGVGLPAHSEVVLFSSNRTGSPQFQNVLLTYKSVDKILRLRTIRQTGTGTYATDLDISATLSLDALGNTTHIVATRGTGGRAHLYVNGTSVASVSSGPITDLTVTGSSQLGCVWGNTVSRINALTGAATPDAEMALDAMCLYETELTSTQISNHYTTAQADGLTRNAIWRSTDGSSWTKVRDVIMHSDLNSTGSGFYIKWDHVVKLSTGFAVYGREPFSGAFPHVVKSTDHGSTWAGTNTKLITSDVTDGAAPIQMKSNGTRIFATLTTRIVSSLPYPQFAYSSDGITFTDLSTTFPPGSSGFNLLVTEDGDPQYTETGDLRITE